MTPTETTISPTLSSCLKNSLLSFASMIPMIIGVVALVAILQTLVPPEKLVGFFTGNPFIDTLIGTVCGAIAAGNPIVSYLLGGELLAHGVSLYAVSAFILAWVTLGFIQLPMEVAAFGARFTLVRNLLAIIATLTVAILTSLTVGLLK
ncbi:MAG: permease [Desulfobacteraceae bacterium 4572_35.2]|nr:MAG: permease [Desulfobacteraceae bacterium 4572_35.2]